MPEDEGGSGLRTQVLLTGTCLVGLLAFLVYGSPFLAYGAILAGSAVPVKAAWESLKEKQLDVNTLMLLAAFGSVALGLPFEGGVLLFLFSLSATLEAYALGRTKSAIEGLIKLRPNQAILVDGAEERTVPVSELTLGQKIKVLPFENVPLDGRIIVGQTSANEAAMTGEARPVSKQPGDLMISGTQNLDGSVVLEVTAVQGSTTLDQVVSLVREAQENQASGERISTWFGSRYTFFVIAVFVVSLVLRLIFGQDFHRAIYASLSVFVALSPCALVIASPAATLSALAWAARRGILVRGGEPIEKAGQASILVLDKTGTLTKGDFTLVKALVKNANGEECCEDLVTLKEGPALEVLGAAASLESHSTHPLAEAITQAAFARGISLPTASDIQVKPGLGLVGVIQDKEILVGQEALIPDLPAEMLQRAEGMRNEGLSTVVLKWGESLALFGLRDEVRPESAQIISRMKALGLKKAVMLTGDSLHPAEAAAKSVGIDEVYARQMPADKEKRIELLEQEGKVIFVGDGVNDAPSLARASLGVAMGGLGSDIAMNAADAVLMKNSLEDLPRLVSLGRMTNRVIKGSLYFAAGVIILLFIGTNLADWLLTEEQRRLILPFAVLGHEGSTVLVILNGLRLLIHKSE